MDDVQGRRDMHGAVSAILGNGDSSDADADAAKPAAKVLALTPRIRHTHETTRKGRTHTDRGRGRCNGGGCRVSNDVFFVGL